MNSINVNTFALFSEININNIARHFGVEGKIEWEEFLKLDKKFLTGILKEPEGKIACLFPYGSMVFFNMQHHEIADVVNYVMGIDKSLKNANYDFKDNYTLGVSDEMAINNDKLTVKEILPYHIEILSTVLAKSIALRKIETDLEDLLHNMEGIIDLVHQGKFNASDKKIGKISAEILRFKYNSISSVMILDKPDITWNNEEAETLYNKLSHLFDLDERYTRLQSKTDTLMDILEVFTTLHQDKKGTTLEWMVIILIVIEVILGFVEFGMNYLR